MIEWDSDERELLSASAKMYHGRLKENTITRRPRPEMALAAEPTPPPPLSAPSWRVYTEPAQ